MEPCHGDSGQNTDQPSTGRVRDGHLKTCYSSSIILHHARAREQKKQDYDVACRVRGAKDGCFIS